MMKLAYLWLCIARFLLLSCSVTASVPLSDNECELVVFSEIRMVDGEINLDFDSLCEFDYLVLEVYDHWGNHVFGMDEEGIEWGDRNIVIESSKWIKGEAVLSGSYYYVVKYKFKGVKESAKQSGTLRALES